MFRNYVLILAFVLLLGISGCVTTPIDCDSPYMLNGSECCLDEDSNDLCDVDEVEDMLLEEDYTNDGDVIVTEFDCSDTDGGMFPFIKGTITEETGNELTDFCRTETFLNEYTCSHLDGRKRSELFDCSNYGENYGCKDGVCSKLS